MHGIGLALVSLVWAGASALAAAAQPDFGVNPIECTDPAAPAGGSIDLPLGGCTGVARSDGYELRDYSFIVMLPPLPIPPPMPLPPPLVVQNDSERDFLNPLLQDMFVHIFGNTKIDVDGAPVQFFVTGTLDGETIVSFSQVVGGHDNHVTWNVAGKKDDVPAGNHTLDMHFGVIQISQFQPSEVSVASLYRVTAQVPEPAAWVLMLGAFALVGLTRGKAVLRR